MSSLEEWANSIRTALINEPKAVPGRAGETPVGDLILQVRVLDPGSAEMESVRRVLEKIVVESATANAEWWMNLSNLLCLSGVPSRELAIAIDQLLASGNPPEAKARAHALIAATDLGRRFTLPRLEAETEIKARFPLQWTDVAVAGGELPAATACIVEGLKGEQIRASDLILRLPAWFQRLGNHFAPFIESWFGALSPVDQGIVSEWLRHRGVRVSARGHSPRVEVGIYAASGVDFIGLPPISRTFIQNAKRRNASLNGTESLLTG